MRRMHRETAACLVFEKGLDAEALWRPATRLRCCRQLADHSQGLLIPLGPTTPHHDGAIHLSCDLGLLSRHEPPRLETRASNIEAKGCALPRRRRTHGRPAHRGPAPLAQRGLQRRPIARAVTQKDHLGALRNPRAHQRDQGDVERLGTMPLGTLAPAPRQGQRASLINDVEQQRQTATTDHTAIHAHHQRFEGSRRPEELDRRSTVHLRQEARVGEPSAQALAPALGLGAIRDGGGDTGPWGALATHDTVDERRQRGQVPGAGACELARIPLCEGVPYGTISAEVVTHRLLLLDWLCSPERVYAGTTS
jgi:hypothetical protein